MDENAMKAALTPTRKTLPFDPRTEAAARLGWAAVGRPRGLWGHQGAFPSGPRRALGAFVTALTVATALFWTTMLTAPPKTQAALSGLPSAPCVQAGSVLAPWFEAELNRRSSVGATRHDDFNLLLTWFQAARRQCASGLTARSIENLKALEAMIARADDRSRPGDE